MDRPIIVEQREEGFDGASRLVQYFCTESDVVKAVLDVINNTHKYKLTSNNVEKNVIQLEYKFGLIKYDVYISIFSNGKDYTNILFDVHNTNNQTALNYYPHKLVAEIAMETSCRLKSIIAIRKNSIQFN